MGTAKDKTGSGIGRSVRTEGSGHRGWWEIQNAHRLSHRVGQGRHRVGTGRIDRQRQMFSRSDSDTSWRAELGKARQRWPGRAG